MLQFEPCNLDSLKRASSIVRHAHFLCNDFSLGTLLTWGAEYRAQLCLRHGTLLIREEISDQPAFSWPVGDDVDGMLDELVAYTEQEGLALRFFALDQATLVKARSDPRFSDLMAAREDKWSDYLYDFQEMAAFSGRRFSGQRNHINKYRKLYGEPVIRSLTEADGEAVQAMLRQYAQEHPGRSALEEAELRHTHALLRQYAGLGMPAACLMQGERVVAFTIGEIVGDTLMIHVEKALKSVEGAYPTLFHGFVNAVGNALGRPLRYVNREDDSGDPGLRTSKQQYHPIAMMPKYQVHVRAPGARIAQLPVLRGESMVLTPIRETDKEAYLRLNTDIENNRWWGYDYRTDENITGPIDENTFYDSVQFDMAAGDSINFAIREREEGPMIGEALLWNFTARRGGEVGCRLFPAWQGKGLGAQAIDAIVRFSLDDLGLTLRARCCLENLPSYRMLTRCGFRECGKDQTYYYFDYTGCAERE